MQQADQGTLLRAADMLCAYAELIRRDGASHVEEHHYLPEVEWVASELRAAATRPCADAMEVALMRIAEYPRTRADEMTAEGARAIARAALAFCKPANPTAKRRRSRPLERPVRPVATPPDMGNTPSRCRRHGRFETEQAEGLRRATMNKQLAQQLWDANARIESMIHIGGMATDGDSLPDVIDDLLQEDDETLAHAFPDMPEWVKEVLDDRHERGPAFSEWAHQAGKLGFVVQFATPVMRNVDEHGGGAYSWGHYYTRWAYGETLEEAASKALAWVAERREHERKKERAEAVGA